MAGSRQLATPFSETSLADKELSGLRNPSVGYQSEAVTVGKLLTVSKVSLCDRQLSELIAVKLPVNFRFPKTAFR